MAFFPPDAPSGMSAVPSLRMASIGSEPSDYQIRLDALKLTASMAASDGCYTPEHFAEWQEFFERSLRDALES